MRREIGALRKIHHPNVVEVFWAGKTGVGDWYLVTEFIDGESLDAFATGRKHLRDREAVDVALDLLGALVAFHPDSARLRQLDAKRREGELPEAESREWLRLKDKGLVHRDIKPLNVMLTRTGAKLLDFNIASRVGDPVHTQSGTPPYQPPDADLTRWDVSTVPVDGRPHGGLIAGRLLEHDIDGSLGSGQDRRARLLVTDVPPEQLGVEPGQRAGVRCLDRGSPPHALRSRSHPVHLPGQCLCRSCRHPTFARDLQGIVWAPVRAGFTGG